MVQSTGQQQCKNFESLLDLGADRQAARALTIISGMLCCLSLLVLYHLCGKRRRQAQDQPGGRGGHAAGWHPGNHPCQLVCTQYREGLLHPPVEFFPKDGDGSMHLCRLGCRCAAHHSWRSALLLQQAQARQHRRKSQVLQQQRLSPKQKLRVVVF